MKLSILLFVFCLLTGTAQTQMQVEFQGKTIGLTAADGLPITADLYMTNKGEAPFIILYHQAGYSRGEYRPIAPRLNKMGFNCLAIDQRSGKEVNSIKNKTYEEAVKVRKGTKYLDAIPDLEAAFHYVKNKLQARNIIVWGSSYSAALVFYLGSEHAGEIDGILAFSPGEYFRVDSKEIKDYASNVNCPVFITSAKNEYNRWKDIYDSIKTDRIYYLPEKEGFHGSRALWPEKEGNRECWKAVEEFLTKVKNQISP